MALFAVLATFPLAGCTESTSANANTGPAPVPEVGVVTVEPSVRPHVRELPGRIAPTRIAEVRPRVSGIIIERVFQQALRGRALEGDPGMVDQIASFHGVLTLVVRCRCARERETI